MIHIESRAKMSTSFLDMSGFEEEGVTLSPMRDNDDEVFLIRVPKGYDIEKLNGVGEYSPPGVVQIETKEGKRGLVSIVELGSFGGKDLDVNLLINSGNDKVTAGPCIKQSLCVSRSVHLNPSVGPKAFGVGGPGPVLMPSGLKPRFTPFGAGCPVHVKHRKHKKHKKKKRESLEVGDKMLNGSSLSINGSDTSSAINHLNDGERPSTSKSDVSDNIFLRLKEDTSESSPSTDISRSHKKKKKQKRMAEPVNFVESNSYTNLNSSKSIEPSGKEEKSFVSDKHKKKRRSEPVTTVSHLSLLSSDSLDEPAENSFVNSHHKKKKKKDKKNSEADDLIFHDTSTNFLSLDAGEKTSSALEKTHVDDKEKKRGRKRKLSSGYHSLESSVLLDESVSIDPSSERKLKKKKRRKEHDT